MLPRAPLPFRRVLPVVSRLRPSPLASPLRLYLAAKSDKNDVEKLKLETNRGEEDKLAKATGVIDKTHLDVVLYYDHIYPWQILTLRIKLYIQVLLFPFRKRFSDDNLKQRIKDILGPLPDGLLREFIPMKRDCGAFVKFEVPPNQRPGEFILEVQHHVTQHQEAYTRTFLHKMLNLLWNHFPKVYAVQGTPWIEDLHRYPSRVILIKFEGVPLTEEEMYVLFRRYGPIVDIKPDASDARVIFELVRLAICAKNCMTGLVVDNGALVLHIQYVPVKKTNYVVDFINNHQRISIPIIIALLAGAAALLFDPIRKFFIEANITQKYSINRYRDNPVVKAVMLPVDKIRQVIDTLYDFIDDTISGKHGYDEKLAGDAPLPDDLTMIWLERYEKAKELRLWIHENVNTFIIVQGPKGLGKEQFVVEDALEPDDSISKDILVLDCDTLSKANGDAGLLKLLACQLGYRPVFTWTNTVSQFIDLGVQGITGTKLGLSESKESQARQMLSLTTAALRSIVSDDYKDYVQAVNRHNHRAQGSDDHIDVVKEDIYLQQHPEVKPIIVIDKFVRKADNSGNDFIYSEIAKWAASLIQANLAHVIFTTNDVLSSQVLAEALPDTVFKTTTLNDALIPVARAYLKSQIHADDKELDACIAPLGGRMLDLQAFVRRNNLGELPTRAITEMINQAAEQILTFFLNKTDPNWNAAQVWVVVKALANNDEVNYTDLAADPVFSLGNTVQTLLVLERHDLISLDRNLGVLSKVRMGRPLFKAACKLLVEDPLVYKIYETDYLKRLIKIETDKMKSFEDELAQIYATDADKRKVWLAEKIDAGAVRVGQLENDVKNVGKLKQDKSFWSRG